MLFLKLAAALICCQFSVEVVPSFTVEVNQPATIVPKAAKSCSCSPQCTCGCNAGLPCKCGQKQTVSAGQSVQVTERFLISEIWCGLCPAAKRRFIASGGSPKNILTMAEAQRRHGVIHSPPHEYTAVVSMATAARTLDRAPSMTSEQVVTPSPQSPPVRFSAPNRYIQWPGWGTIDLETYNRNCNCNMCISIRSQQQEYRRQLEVFQQSQSQVTPDQEGTPHALVEAMLDSMAIHDGDVLGELGCGDGRILISAAKRGIRGIGIELDPARAHIARNRVKEAGVEHLVTIETGDALEFDLSRVTAATAYLYPPLLTKLSPRLKSLRVVASPYHEIPGLPMTNQGDFWIYRQ